MMAERFRPFAAVYTLLRRDNEIFMLRRQNSGFYDGWYTLPSGHIDGNEPIAVAAAREAREEARVTIRPQDLQLLHVLHRYNPDDEQGDPREYLDFFFEASHWEGEPVVGEPHKSDDGQWFLLDELPAQTIPYLQDVLGAIARQQHYSAVGFTSV